MDNFSRKSTGVVGPAVCWAPASRNASTHPEEERPRDHSHIDDGGDPDLRRMQRRFAEQLSDTPTGRRLVELAYPDITITTDALVAEIRELSDEMMGRTTGHRSTAAAIALARINSEAAYHHRTDLQHAASRWYRWAQGWYRLADRVWRNDEPAANAAALTRFGAVAGQLATFLAALLLVVEIVLADGRGFTVAAVLIGARVATTLAVWKYAHFPGDDDPDHPMLVTTPTRCVLDHAGDAAVVAALGGVLIGDGHPVGGGIVIASAFVFVFATLYRVAGARYGTVVSRLHLERMTRSAAVLISLVLASFDQSWWKLSAGFALIGPGTFAMIEIVETRRALAARRRVLAELPSPAQTGPAAGMPPQTASRCGTSHLV